MPVLRSGSGSAKRKSANNFGQVKRIQQAVEMINFSYGNMSEQDLNELEEFSMDELDSMSSNYEGLPVDYEKLIERMEIYKEKDPMETFNEPNDPFPIELLESDEVPAPISTFLKEVHAMDENFAGPSKPAEQVSFMQMTMEELCSGQPLPTPISYDLLETLTKILAHSSPWFEFVPFTQYPFLSTTKQVKRTRQTHPCITRKPLAEVICRNQFPVQTTQTQFQPISFFLNSTKYSTDLGRRNKHTAIEKSPRVRFL